MALATAKGATGVVRPFDARARTLFLDALALTANVSASARKAGIAAHIAYGLRPAPPQRQPQPVALGAGFQRRIGQCAGRCRQRLGQ